MRKQIRRTALAFTALALIATAAGWMSHAAARGRDPSYARVLGPKLEALLKELLVPGAVVVVRSPELGNWSAGFGTGKLGTMQPSEPVTICSTEQCNNNAWTACNSSSETRAIATATTSTRSVP